MPDRPVRRAIARVLDHVPTKRAIVILVDDDGEIETGAAGLSLGEQLLACWSLAVSMAAELQQAQGERFAPTGDIGDAMEQAVRSEPARKRLYVAGGDVRAMRRAGQIGAAP